LLFSLPSATHKAESETQLVTRKIRIYPNVKTEAFSLLSLHRRAYNLAIEHFKEVDNAREVSEDEYKLAIDAQLGVTELRRAIKAQVKEEWEGRFFTAEVAGEAVRAAFKTKNAVLSKRKKGLSCAYSFKSIKESSQYFVLQRMSKGYMSKWHLTEQIAEESFGKTTNICFENGRWFACTLKSINIKKGAENQGLSLCSIDPGVRTFATVFAQDKVSKVGDDFYKNKVFPLLLKLDKLYGLRQEFLNKKPDRTTQFFRDTMRYYTKKLNKLRNKVKDRIDDLHRRTAFDLVNDYDIILLPTFETSEMSKKVGRKIHSKAVRAMLGLGHYRFRQTMEWMCKKYGKTLVLCNEAYTSKTQSWDGTIVPDLGGAKIIGTTIKVDRDINGARGIMLRALTAASAVNRACCV